MLRHLSRGRSGRQNKSNAQSQITGDLQQMLDRVLAESGHSPDIVIRHLKLGGPVPVPVEAAIVYLNALSNQQMINNFVIKPLMGLEPEKVHAYKADRLMKYILENALSLGETSVVKEWNDIMMAVLSGDTVLLVEGSDQGIVTGTAGGEWRAVNEPTSQLVVRGPKDSFVESIATNISLIRRRIKSPDLWLESMKIGSVTHTHVAMMYMKGCADPNLVEEVRSRLKGIRIDGVLESAYIEEFIQDKTFTPFPTIFNTERPDVAAGNLLEGRVVILVDGTPYTLILPTVFAQFMQSPEDYAQRFDISILMRIIRYICFVILLLGPAVYVALTTFHYEMIPTLLLVSLMAQREGVPFPAFVEAIIMEVVFEILREAGVRMPRAIGQTVSIVGALILGQAVVEAGIITPIMVIVVALTGIASFALPSYNLSIAGRLFRFYFLLLAGLFGFYGITLGLILMVAHMNSIRSFGVPYLSPFSPFVPQAQKDVILRLPIWMHGWKPLMTSSQQDIEKTREIKPQGSGKSKSSEDQTDSNEEQKDRKQGGSGSPESRQGKQEEPNEN
ncbi:spore germination protein [Paenibacillus sp. DXFW5]|uniref:Spore germination protein n=1 Tax=Paenibacillus rhizolycopersici TaxID=2780073 RepID=A0ABS2HAL8_9BACL|nr:MULTISPECIES: spore germination protein [Paenibacillus]MBM6998432.1 spore germination protein [Paenibacillus rhizolycopersici]GIP47545.1 spore germination protein KA [Paenibacillus sp. J53TS2]